MLREQTENKLVTLQKGCDSLVLLPQLHLGCLLPFPEHKKLVVYTKSVAVAHSPISLGEGVPSLGWSSSNFDVYLVLMKLLDWKGVKFIQPSPQQRNSTVLVAKLLAPPKNPSCFYSIRQGSPVTKRFGARPAWSEAKLSLTAPSGFWFILCFLWFSNDRVPLDLACMRLDPCAENLQIIMWGNVLFMKADQTNNRIKDDL